jgi:hypothetical protein
MYEREQCRQPLVTADTAGLAERKRHSINNIGYFSQIVSWSRVQLK